MTNLNELSKTDVEAKIQQRIQESQSDPKVFINRFCYTFDPKRPPNHLEFNLFPFQEELVDELVNAIESGEDLFVEKSREMGVTYVTLYIFLWFWLNVPGSNFLLGSRKEDYVDNRNSNAASNKEESLFGKLEYIINRLPAFMLPEGFNPKKHFTYMSLVNPVNGNVITGESSNPNFSRGGRFKAILMDEFAFWDNDTAAWGSTGDTSNCRIVLTTPGIRPSKAKRLRFGEDGEHIKVVTYHYTRDPRKDDAWVAHEKKRRSVEDFAREVEINWETSITGKVYNEIQYAQVGDFPYIPLWDLYDSWDFGLDGLALQFWQPNPNNGKMRLVDSYYNMDKPIQFYFPMVGQPLDSLFVYTEDDLEAIEAFKNFKKAVHYGDPDVGKRSMTSKVMTSVRLELQNIGVYVQTNTISNDWISRRDRTKVLLQTGIEVNKTKRNKTWLSALQNARYPQRSETSQSTAAVAMPIHDWTSHHRTATEYLAVNYQPAINQADTVEPEWAAERPSWSRS